MDETGNRTHWSNYIHYSTTVINWNSEVRFANPLSLALLKDYFFTELKHKHSQHPHPSTQRERESCSPSITNCCP